MLRKVTFNTDLYEIQILNKGNEGWEVKVFETEYGIKELHEIHVVENYSTAELYLKKKYLKNIEYESKLKV